MVDTSGYSLQPPKKPIPGYNYQPPEEGTPVTPIAGGPTVPFGADYKFNTPGETPPQTEEQQQATNLQSRASAILQEHGIHTGGNEPMSYDEMLDYFDKMGLDTTNPQLQTIAQNWSSMPDATYSQQTRLIQGAAPGLQDFLKPQVPYQQLLTSIGGFPSDQFRPSPGAAHLYARDPALQGLTPPSSNEYVDLKDKGALVWANGVIVNYAPTTEGVPTGVVYDNGDPNQEGSYSWQRAAQQNWSPEKIQNWRTKLFKAGYVDTKKGGMWDTGLIDATARYYEAKYTYGTDVAEAGLGKSAGATGAPTPQDIQKLIQKNVPTIHSTITDQYLTIFNQPPTQDELASWTGFITRTATDLATGKMNQRLTPDQAISQAQASMASKIFKSPQGQITYEAAKENTSLHDGLTTAITATRGLA